MKKLITLFAALTLLWGLCACTAIQSDALSAEVSQGPTWQEQYDLGVRYLSEGNYEEAIIAFTAAIEIDPKRVPAYVGRGDAYVKSGETEENLAAAKADYEKAIELDEANAEAYLGLADVHIRQGDYEKALEILLVGYDKTGKESIKELLEKLDPHTDPPLNHLGGTEFFKRSDYIEFELLPPDVQDVTTVAINAIISNDTNTLLSLGSVSDEAYRFLNGKYTFWGTYKINLYILPFDGQSYGFEFRPQNGMGYYCYVWRPKDSRSNSILISQCICSEWNYNGDMEMTEVVHYGDGLSSVEFEQGQMINGLREGVFVNTAQFENDPPYSKSEEYRNGYLVSSTDTLGRTTEESDDYVAGIRRYRIYMNQFAADELFW